MEQKYQHAVHHHCLPIYLQNDVLLRLQLLLPFYAPTFREHNAKYPVGTAEKKLPNFFPGDIVKIGVRITEGKRDRIQYFEGVCIAKKNRDLNSSFTVRKISFGEGVERTFALYSPIVDSIKVIRSGKVRRAKLYYLRDRTGKSARIAEKIKKKIGIDVDVKTEQPTAQNVTKTEESNITEETKVEKESVEKKDTSEKKNEKETLKDKK